jgi:ATP synthase F1 gamma subunit
MDKKTITKEITDLQVLENLTNAYAEISSSRMKKTRNSVLSSRSFLEEIQAVFKEIQDSYRYEFIALAKKKGIKKGDKITFLSHNGKSVAVFISSNTGFYGDLSRKVFDLFTEKIKNDNFEATIVGNLGLSMFKELNPNRSYSFFELPDYGFDREKLAELAKHLVEYEEIHIFYGKFKNLVNQEPEEVIISSETPIEGDKKVNKVKYLFEPSLEDILIFFEKEMFSSIFEQTISESQLAKFASRMLAMDRAGEKIRKNLLTTKENKLKLMHAIANKKQIEYLSSTMSARRFT